MAYDPNLTLAENDLFARVDRILLDRAKEYARQPATFETLGRLNADLNNALQELRRKRVVGTIVPTYNVLAYGDGYVFINRLPVNPSGLPPMLHPEQIR